MPRVRSKPDHEFTAGTTAKPLTVLVKKRNADGSLEPNPLTDIASVVFRMVLWGIDTPKKVNDSAATFSTSAGTFTYSGWTSGEVDAPGDYDGFFGVTYNNGKTDWLPDDGPLWIRINPNA